MRIQFVQLDPMHTDMPRHHARLVSDYGLIIDVRGYTLSEVKIQCVKLIEQSQDNYAERIERLDSLFAMHAAKLEGMETAR